MNVPKDQMNVDGIKSDGVGHDVATPEQLAKFDEAYETLSRFQVPILVHADNPHERLFIAAFDGMGNNKFTDPAHATNIAKIIDAIEAAHAAGNKQIYAHYIPGPYTQKNSLLRIRELVQGFLRKSRPEDMYDCLVRQVSQWATGDPNVQVRVMSIGFGFGGGAAVGFSRLLHQKGIVDLRSKAVDAEGRETYSRYIVAPGKTIQSVALFNPVATGIPMNFNRSLPPSVVSGFQLSAAHEHRIMLTSDQLMPLGLSDDGRFLHIKLPGDHADVGGGYHRHGLSSRSYNVMVDYCNAMCDEPFLQKRFAPNDPRLNVIHRSTDSIWTRQGLLSVSLSVVFVVFGYSKLLKFNEESRARSLQQNLDILLTESARNNALLEQERKQRALRAAASHGSLRLAPDEQCLDGIVTLVQGVNTYMQESNDDGSPIPCSGNDRIPTSTSSAGASK